MLLKKTGFPEENELVMCTVTAIHYHSVFAKIEEYDKSGMIHISEVSPGRIRNIRDFVKEGKKVVCKVLRINLEKGHIDLSLRRVNEGQRKNKISELKQQQLSEKILENIAKKNKKDIVKLFEDVYEKVTKQYDTLFDAFEAVANATLDLDCDVATIGSKHATFIMSGCQIISMENPSLNEGLTESTIEVRPENLIAEEFNADIVSGIITPY